MTISATKPSHATITDPSYINAVSERTVGLAIALGRVYPRWVGLLEMRRVSPARK